MEFVYNRPDDKQFRSVLKFVLKNGEGLKDLRKCVHGKARYTAFPDIIKPVSLHLKISEGNSTEDQIKQLMDNFFDKYICLNHAFPIQALQKAKALSSSTFTIKSLNTFIHWYGKSKNSVVIVGLKNNAETALTIMKEAVTNVARTDSVWLLVYHKPKHQHFKNILKYVLTNKEELNAFEEQIPQCVEYEAFPDNYPVGLKLQLKPGCSDKDTKLSLDTFFEDYSCIEEEFNAHKIEAAKQQSQSSLTDLNIPRIFIRWSGFKQSTVMIVGSSPNVRKAMSFIKDVMSNTCMPRSNNDGADKVFVYEEKSPKFKEVLKFVLKKELERQKLNQLVKGFAVYEVFPSDQAPTGLKFSPLPDVDYDGFVKQIQAVTSDFFSKYDCLMKTYDVDLLNEAKRKYSISFDNLQSSQLFISYLKDSVKIVGQESKVEEAVSVIENAIHDVQMNRPPGSSGSLNTGHTSASLHQNENSTQVKQHYYKKHKLHGVRGSIADCFTLNCPKQICKILIGCKLIDKLNYKYNGKVHVFCNVKDEIVELKGDSQYIKQAEKEIFDMDLIEKEPPLENLKLELLKSVLMQSQSTSEDMLSQAFSDKAVRGAVVIKDDQVILVAVDEANFEEGVRLLDGMIHMKEVKAPAGKLPEFIQSLIKSIPESKDLIIKKVVNAVVVVGLHKEEVENITDLLMTSFKQFGRKSVFHLCETDVAKFICTFYKNDPNFPPSVTISRTAVGVQLDGLTSDAEKAVKYLNAKHIEAKDLTVSAHGLKDYVGSTEWRAFVNLIESTRRCLVLVQQEESGQSNDLMTNSLTGSYLSGSMQKSSYETKIMGITVTVCEGDITQQTTDVIVNGCTSDFDLAKGPLSSSILQRAGRELQVECTSNPKLQTPHLRATRGMKLKCKHVLHLITPHSADNFAAKIVHAFDCAEKLRANSLAIPSLGAGQIGLKISDVAAGLRQSVEQFASKNPKHVKKIKVVLLDGSLIPDILQHMMPGYETYNSHLQQLKGSLIPKESMKLGIVYDDENCLAETEQMICEHLAEIKKPKVFTNDVIERFDAHDLIELYEAAVSHDAMIEVDETSKTITVRGLKDNVARLSDTVKEVIHDYQMTETASKQCVWKWSNSSTHPCALPLRVSRYIESQFERDPTAAFSVFLFGHTMKVSLQSKTYTFNTESGSLKRCELVESAVKLPSHWESMGSKSWDKFTLDEQSAEYQCVANKFRKSNPTLTAIKKIQRIQNPTLYEQYMLKKKDVKRHMTSSEPVERELFHGTSELEANKICAQGFDKGFAGKNATRYGKGCYFAVESSYSEQYTDRKSILATMFPSASKVNAHMFLARVLTGDYCQGSGKLRAPPKKSSSQYANRLYDSVVNNVEDPKIFVVFKDSSVYPLYLITFV